MLASLLYRSEALKTLKNVLNNFNIITKMGRRASGVSLRWYK